MLIADRSFRYVLISVLWVVIVLLTASYGASKTDTPYDKSPHSTAPPSISTAGAAASRRPADLILNQYLKFSRLTSEDGLSNDQIRGIAQDNHGFIGIATLDGQTYRHEIWYVWEDGKKDEYLLV